MLVHPELGAYLAGLTTCLLCCLFSDLSINPSVEEANDGRKHKDTSQNKHSQCNIDVCIVVGLLIYVVSQEYEYISSSYC